MHGNGVSGARRGKTEAKAIGEDFGPALIGLHDPLAGGVPGRTANDPEAGRPSDDGQCPDSTGEILSGDWRGLYPELARDIVDVAPDGPAVYFLLVVDEVVYVGASMHPADRVRQHRSAKHKRFDAVLFLPVDPNDLTKIESTWIRLLNPRFNGEWGTRYDKSEHDILTARVTPDVADALRYVAEMNRRPITVQLAIAIEDHVLNSEDELRRAGKWNAALDRLKAERRPNTD